MGMYFNPGNEGFRKTSQSRIYVDKTCLIKEINLIVGDEKNCVAVSHARRFGKSQAARMLEAYYSRGCDSRAMFEHFKIGQEQNWDRYLNKFNVIHLDISSMVNAFGEELVPELTQVLFDEFAETYPNIKYAKPIGKVFEAVYRQSNCQFVIILDEWDCVVRNYADKPAFVHEYMQFLHDLFKSAEAQSFLALGYITGILPIKKIEDESALNNFIEYTMVACDELTTFFGFTEPEVQDLCLKYNMSYESVKAWYDGYLISGEQMYNPDSVYQCMHKHALRSYWKNTSAFASINTYITRDFAGLKEDVLTILEGGRVHVNVNPFKNDLSLISSKDDALTALIHLGYLGYDAVRKQAFVPNYEVKTAFQDALVTGVWPQLAALMNQCDELLDATLERDAGHVAEIMERAHETYTSVLAYNNENALSCVLTMAYFTAQAYYNIERELPSGKGFADLVFLPRKDADGRPALVVELKWDKDADTAIRQIKEKRYAKKLTGYSDKVLLVGINYDKDSKEHTCVIEEYQGC